VRDGTGGGARTQAASEARLQWSRQPGAEDRTRLLPRVRGVGRPFASFCAAVLAEIYLCNVCSCQETLRRNGRGQGGALQRARAERRALQKRQVCDVLSARLPA
jgi:hypothetical protein